VSVDIDFFISFNSADTEWAEWIAWVLEKDGGYKVRFQKWDFAPGTNFVLQMQNAAARAKHTIAVLSPAFLRSEFAAAEWAAAFAQDPQGLKRSLIPVMVAECETAGLLASIVYIHLVGLEEGVARETLLRGVAERPAGYHPGPRPTQPPTFPGTVRPVASLRSGSSRPTFPGPAAPVPPVSWTPLPAKFPVRWEAVPPLTQVQLDSTRLELHLSPLPGGYRAVTQPGSAAQGALVSAGRQSRMFPAEATVSTRMANHGVQAVLTDSAGSAMTGLRADDDGYRCGWLTLPLAAPTGKRSVVTDGLGRLLAAVTPYRAGLSEKAAIIAAIRRSSTKTISAPGSLSIRYLAAHIQQVADDLATKLMAADAAEQ
jgi:hypothetical protein